MSLFVPTLREKKFERSPRSSVTAFRALEVRTVEFPVAGDGLTAWDTVKTLELRCDLDCDRQNEVFFWFSEPVEG